ncbi:MAG: inner membrane CreD family protein [Ignavibacteriales bacterium]|nr:inner membrane CreD family protein [Ignavibacteriales bacterium]
MTRLLLNNLTLILSKQTNHIFIIFKGKYLEKESITLRIILIAAVIIILLVPLFMIQSLITERQYYRDEAVREVSKSWAEAQTVGGPILTLIDKSENLCS